MSWLGDCARGVTDSCQNSLSGQSATLFMLMVNTIYSRKCTFLKADDFPNDVNRILTNREIFDFIVIGAGSAGSVVASRLSENPQWRVLLLEAGGVPPVDAQIPSLYTSLFDNSDVNWYYPTEKTNSSCLSMLNGQCVWNPGKMLGGSSSMNGMIYFRGSPADYDEWAEIIGDQKWNWTNVLPYFRKLESVRWDQVKNSTVYGHNGPLRLTHYISQHPLRSTILQAYNELGYSFNIDPVNIGYYETIMSIDEYGRRESTAKAYLTTRYDNPDYQPNKRNNLYISTNSHVMRLLIDSRNVANGVRVRVNNRIINIYARNEVIISAGVINSPQILKLSGIGPRNELRNFGITPISDLPVGHYLKDHLIAYGIIIKVDNSSIPQVTSEQRTQEIFEYFNNGSGAFATIGLNNINMFNDPISNSTELPTIQWIVVPFSVNDSNLVVLLGANEYPNDISDDLLRQNARAAMLFLIPVLLQPESKGHIELRSANPFDKPKVFSNILSEPKDIEVLLGSIRFVHQFIGTHAMKQINASLLQYNLPNCARFEFASNGYWECLFRNLGGTAYHPVGTCRMARRNDDGIVDGRLRVYGIKNLRVIDASIMPNTIHGNTNGATIMIGERGADLIKEDFINN